MAGLAVNAVGVAAALCSMASFVPQAVKIIRDRDISGVSTQMYVVTVIGFALWSAYGVLLQSWPLIASNLLTLSLASLVLILKLLCPKAEPGRA